MAKLVLKAFKMVDDAADGRAVVLFNEVGEMLPNQVAVSTAFDTETGQSHVTVTFAIDGDKIRFE